MARRKRSRRKRSIVASTSAPRHGVEDDIPRNSIDNGEMLLSSIYELTPRSLQNQSVLQFMWILAHGPASTLKQIYVVGNRAALDQWAPSPNKSYPSFITSIEYVCEKSDSDTECNCMECDCEECQYDTEPQWLMDIEDGDFVILLPGEYDWNWLWYPEFKGTNLIVGVTQNPQSSDDAVLPIIYNSEELTYLFDCEGITCMATCRLEARKSLGEFINVTGNLRLLACHLEPRDPDPKAPWRVSFDTGGLEIGDALTAAHGAYLSVQRCVMGRFSQSCIKCEGRCAVHLERCCFVSSGRGDFVQRISKANGTFPTVLQGRHPAIAVSYAATVKAVKCSFFDNYGYPIQYANKAEQEGTVRQDLLDKDPKKFALDAVEDRSQKTAEYPKLYSDLSTEEAKERLYQEMLAKQLSKIVQVGKKRKKGSVTIVDCDFEENGKSPYLPNAAESTTLEPWFASDSRIMELVDAEEGCEAVELHYMHNEAKADRDAFRNFRLSLDDEETTGSPATELFVRLGGFANSTATKIEKWFSRIFSSSNQMLINAKRNAPALSSDSDREGTRPNNNSPPRNTAKEFTAFGILDEEEKAELRSFIASEVEDYRKRMYNMVKALSESSEVKVFFESSEVDRLLQICWGCLTSDDACHTEVIAAEACLLSLHWKNSNSISPYRAEVLVERLQCDDIPQERTKFDGCGCAGLTPVSQCAAFLLGLSHQTVVDALLDLLKNEGASGHGRSNAGGVLMRLAFAKPELRPVVVEALSSAVNDSSTLSIDDRAKFVGSLAGLHAIEAQDVVKNAAMEEKLNNRICGYIQFLMKVGLPIDLNDPVVAEEVENPIILGQAGWSERMFQEKSAEVTARTRKDIAKHNRTLDCRSPCHGCGKCPVKGKSFPCCERCREVVYCGRECQRAGWKEHKKRCKTKKRCKSQKRRNKTMP